MRSDPAPARLHGIGTTRLERALGAVVGVLGLLWAAQCADSLWAERYSLATPLGLVVVALLGASVIAALLAGLLRLGARGVFAAAFTAYLAALLIWPAALRGHDPADDWPLLVAVWTPYAAYLAIAVRRVALPLAAAVAVPAYVVAVLVAVDGATAVDALQQGATMTVLGVVTTVLIALLRRGIAGAEQAHDVALERFAAMRTGQATEQERVRTDALVHDSVLTTFISAASARTAEEEALVARMAARALRVLGRIGEPGRAEPSVTVREALERSRSELGPVADAFDLRIDDADVLLPESVAEALVTAMVQAMVNSVRHAGEGATRLVRVEREGDHLRVEVRDDGRGFDVDAVDAERLGVRVSILERVRSVGGLAEIVSHPGVGTAVLLRSPALVPAAAPLVPA